MSGDAKSGSPRPCTCIPCVRPVYRHTHGGMRQLAFMLNSGCGLVCSEYAYERWSICFSFGQAPGTFKLHVVDNTILNTKLQVGHPN